MSNENEIEHMLRARGLDAPHLTSDAIDRVIVDEAYHVFPGTTVTVCCLTLVSGFATIGYDATVSPENFDAEIGRKSARENARREVWALEGYRVKRALHQQQLRELEEHGASALDPRQQPRPGPRGPKGDPGPAGPQHAGTTGMPLYRSHKIVRAARIIELLPKEGVVTVILPDARVLDVSVPGNLFGKCGDRDGYLVEYDDGYLSWSPAEAFEGGYTLIEESGA